MTSYRVIVQRTEYWLRSAFVEADSAAAARESVEKSLGASGWVGVFPDNEDGDLDDIDYKVLTVEREDS